MHHSSKLYSCVKQHRCLGTPYVITQEAKGGVENSLFKGRKSYTVKDIMHI